MTTARNGNNGPAARRGQDAVTDLLTVPEVMAALQVSKWMVYELIRGNRIVTVKIGRCRRIPADALADYLERLREGSAA